MNSLKTSIGKKQIVAVTGLALILFVIGHLAGNLTFFLGPDVFNGYAKKLTGLRPALYVVEAGLLVIFCIHLFYTFMLVQENIQARSTAYFMQKSSPKRSLATKMMSISGFAVFAFVIWHLLDFTFVDKSGPLSLIDGKSFGLYGIVYNAFKDPIHSLLYIGAMVAIGLHLRHGIQSFCQTFGFTTEHTRSKIEAFSILLAVIVSVLFSSIPLYTFFVLG